MRTFNEFKNGAEKNIFNAMWQYLIDHADITNEGVYFIKFHTNSKEEFTKHIKARMKGVYRNSLDEMTGLAEIKRIEQQNRIINGLKKSEAKNKLKSMVAPNLKELQKFKTPLPKRKWYERLINNLLT